jgi:hypothetical protein
MPVVGQQLHVHDLQDSRRHAWLWRLALGLSQQRPVFHFRPVHVRFVVDKLALGQALLPVLQFSPVSIIPPMRHTHLNTTGRSLGHFNQSINQSINALAVMGKHWIKSTSTFFQALKVSTTVYIYEGMWKQNTANYFTLRRTNWNL